MTTPDLDQDDPPGPVTLVQGGYRVDREPNGAVVLRVDPDCSLGEVVWHLAATWPGQQLVGQQRTVTASMSAELRPHVERTVMRNLFVDLADHELLPLSMPRPVWELIPYGMPMEPVPFVPGETETHPGDVATCSVEVHAIPAPTGRTPS